MANNPNFQMKILWLSNFPFKTTDSNNTGTWVQPLAEALNKKDNLCIANVSWGEEKVENVNGIKQWTIPAIGLKKYGHEAPNSICSKVKSIIEDFQPDIVHIWGTESAWASIHRKGYIQCPALLEMQGILGQCYASYLGGMTFKDILKSIHLKEILMPWRNLWCKQRTFYKRSLEELRNISSFSHIAVQSEWVKANVKHLTDNVHIYRSKIMLRKEFYLEHKSQYVPEHPILFFSFSGAIPYKGLHQLIRMLVLIKKEYPNIELRIAGEFYIGNKLIDGYSLFLKQIITAYKLEPNVSLLGILSPESLIQELKHANICVVPSFVETYCLAFAEAMIIGCPVVCSNAAAMPELAIANKEALFYSPNDIIMGAHQIKKLLAEKSYAQTIAHNARVRRLTENAPTSVIDNQIRIYQELLYNEQRK